jgi:ABC-type lipoprotein release transport system permease subunit
MTMVAGGVAVGLLATTRAMSSFLFGIGAADISTFAAVAALVTIIALAACPLPARRAVGVEPASVLRDE